tara:strand:+ start:4768 stop:5127 length:360 start_codon:yes stop_codon:yes gene_type:complete
MTKKIVQHPSTPDDLRQPEVVAERLLAEMCPLMIELIADWEFDIHDEDFARDFRIVVELLRAILYGQLGVGHELHVGLGSNNPLKQVEDSMVQQEKIKDMLNVSFSPDFIIPTPTTDDE